MRGSRLPGKPARPHRPAGPCLATPLLVVLALLVSSIQIPAADRATDDRARENHAAVANSAPPDSASIQVQPAFRAEFQPTEGSRAVRRSRIFRIEVSVWSVTPPNRLTLVVGSVPDDPAILVPIGSAHRADGESSIRPPRPGSGAPVSHEPSGWSAWEVALLPAMASANGVGTQGTGLPDPRQQLFGAVSVDSATVATLGSWIGLFDEQGRRLATAQIQPVAR